ncbi:hypothetical protein SUGI_0522850 [Cryptomeria japonica]|uniref:pentatricopeptide repeat-containing protein At5g18390, mitochondrial n=1 Tax=Cryptomeria japonica TaxID=3369 RepID=UPI00240896B7|nr:pentatricopeptide repeat-containing protein At5g18390, mitochondrial [Cryptomeria japonica]GLJ26801.1 hypothetical protein SUGI_0522850 [Cryptomeria japonica]
MKASKFLITILNRPPFLLSQLALSNKRLVNTRITFSSSEEESDGNGREKIPLEASASAYRAAIYHICTIVRSDSVYMERSLQNLNLKLTSELVWRVLKDCAAHGKEAYRFFNWARHQTSYDPTTIEFEEMIQILGRTENWDPMWKTLNEMRRGGYALTDKTFALMIESYGKARLVNRAVEVFNRMKSTFNRPQTTPVYNALLRALCEARNHQGGYALIRRMIRKGSKPDTETYSILVNSWCREGKLQEAQEFLEEMSIMGHNPTAASRDLLVNGLLTAGNLDMAKEFVRKMTDDGFVPNLQTFNTFLESLSNAGEIDLCVHLMSVSAKLGLCPDSNTYRIMIRGTSRAGNIAEAFRILHSSMEDGHKPFPGLYAPIIKALCKKGQFAEAYSLFSDMKKKGHPPNKPIYIMLIRLHCRAGRYLEAANFLVEMTELNFVPRPQNFDMVTKGLKTIGKYDLAEKIDLLELSVYGM